MDARASVPRAELKCGAQEIFLRAFKAQEGAEELKPKETHVSGCLPIQKARVRLLERDQNRRYGWRQLWVP